MYHGFKFLFSRNEPFEFGCTQLLIPPHIVKELIDKDLVNISPAGAVFVKQDIRTGILPQMLSEILKTRIMVTRNFFDKAISNIFEPVDVLGETIDERI